MVVVGDSRLVGVVANRGLVVVIGSLPTVWDVLGHNGLFDPGRH